LVEFLFLDVPCGFPILPHQRYFTTSYILVRTILAGCRCADEPRESKSENISKILDPELSWSLVTFYGI
jgi:hypothetical protein